MFNQPILKLSKTSLVLLGMIFLYFISIDSYAKSLNNEVQEVRYNRNTLYASDDVDNYYEELLRYALEATVDEFGPYKLLPQNIKMVQQRSVAMIEQSLHIDVIWSMTSVDRESRMQAVYIPLLKGLLGYRVFLIRQGEQQRFNNISTVNALKKITIGQGVNWPDTEILEKNKFQVVKSLGNNLHDMLESKRFDMFPRSVLEVVNEDTSRPNLTIESNLLLKYPAPLYFFVNKSNKKLAKRLTIGLSRLVESGSFDEIFYSNKGPATLMKELGIGKRKVIEINNPNISRESEKLINNPSLWFL